MGSARVWRVWLACLWPWGPELRRCFRLALERGLDVALPWRRCVGVEVSAMLAENRDLGITHTHNELSLIHI